MLDLTLHHIGILVKDLQIAAIEYTESFGYEILSPVIHDEIQTAFVQLLRLKNQQLFVELITPDGPQSKLSNALQKGGGLNHLCYVCPDITDTCRILRTKKMFILQAPLPSEVFKGRLVAWLMGVDSIPIELLEPGEDKWVL